MATDPVPAPAAASATTEDLLLRAAPVMAHLAAELGRLVADPAVAGFAAVGAARMFAHVLAHHQGRPLTECVQRCEVGLQQALASRIEVAVAAAGTDDIARPPGTITH